MIGEGGASSWMMIDSENSDMDEDIQIIEASATAAADKTDAVKITEASPVTVDSDSEEESVAVISSSKASSLTTNQINLTKAVKRRRHKKRSKMTH